MSFEQPEQHPHYQIEETQTQRSSNVAAAQTQIATRNQCAANQRQQKNRNHGNDENTLEAARWRLLLPQWYVPWINRFEVNRLASIGSGFDMDLLVGTHSIGSVPRCAFVISVLRDPCRRDLLESGYVEPCFVKQGRPVERSLRKLI